MSKKRAAIESVLFLILVFILPLFFSLIIKFADNLNQLWKTIFFGLEAATPCISAIICILIFNKWQGLKLFLKSKYLDHFSFKKCLIGIVIPFLLYTIAKGITYLTPCTNAFLGIITSKKFFILLWSLIAEELGWRGYLQERIEDLVGSVFTPLIIGLIWALWHYHFFLIGSLDVPFLIFMLGCIAESFGYYLLTKWSNGNIIPASLWHFTGNVFINLYLLNPNCNNESFIPYFISVLCFCVIIFYYVFFFAKKHK